MVHKGTSSSYRLIDCIGLWSCLAFSELHLVVLALDLLNYTIVLQFYDSVGWVT